MSDVPPRAVRACLIALVAALAFAPAAVAQTSSADLTMTKDASVGETVVGGLVTFTLTVRNLGSASANDIVVRDPVPPGFTVRTVGSGCTEVAGVVTCTAAILAIGDSHLFSFVAEANASAAGTTQVNTAL